MNGKFTSNCRHLPTPWPYWPQEKHNTVDQSLRAVAGRFAVPMSAFLESGISALLLYQWVQSEAVVPVPARPEASIASRSANPTVWAFSMLRSSVSTWLFHALHLSTISRMGVSGGTLLRCRRRSQFWWPARNRSRIRWVLAFGHKSPKTLTASVSSATANFDGSSPSCLTVLSNWRR